MTKPTATYDPEVDAISVRFAPEDAHYVESEEVAPGVVLDYDTDGNVIGLELLYVRDLLRHGRRGHGDYEASRGRVGRGIDGAGRTRKAAASDAGVAFIRRVRTGCGW